MGDEHHGHDHGGAGVRDILEAGSTEGIRALRIGTAGLAATALFQLAVVAVSGSAALLSDTLHNIGDVLTTVGLWIAFVATRRAANDRYTFGYQRFEDLAGLGIVLAIFASAALAGYESYSHLRSGEVPSHLWAALGAGVVGVVGNEAVAQVKMRAGRRIKSEALIAEGQHSRVDGLTSLAVVAGVGGVLLGIDWMDPAAGLAIAVVIGIVGVRTGRPILAKLADRVDPAIVERVAAEAAKDEQVLAVHSIRARHAGRGLYVLLHVDLPPDLLLKDAHARAEDARHRILHAIPQVVQVDIHIDPAGPAFHRETDHHFEHEHERGTA